MKKPGNNNQDLVRRVNLAWYPLTLLPLVIVLYLGFTGALPFYVVIFGLFLGFFWIFSLIFALYEKFKRRKAPGAQ